MKHKQKNQRIGSIITLGAAVLTLFSLIINPFVVFASGTGTGIPGDFEVTGYNVKPEFGEVFLREKFFNTVVQPGTKLFPQQTYELNIAVSEFDQFSQLKDVTVKMVYMNEVPTQESTFGEGKLLGTNASSDLFVWRWQENGGQSSSGIVFDSPETEAVSSWAIPTPAFVPTDLTDFSFEFRLPILISKVARLTGGGRWYIAVQVVDDANLTDFTVVGAFHMGWYGELQVAPDAKATWGTVQTGASYEATDPAQIQDVRFISNGIFDQSVASSAYWTSNRIDPNTGTWYKAAIQNDGVLDNYLEFALGANYEDSLPFATQVATSFRPMQTKSATSESGILLDYFIYLKLAEGFRNGLYSGTIKLGISNGGNYSNYVAMNEQTSQLYDSLEIALAQAQIGSTLRLLKDVTIPNWSVNRPVNIDFDGHTLTGNLSVELEDATTMSLKGRGTVTGNLIVDAPNLTLSTNLTIQGNTEILSIVYNSFHTSGSHLNGIEVLGPGRIVAVNNPTPVNLIVKTPEPVILDGIFEEALLENNVTEISIFGQVKNLLIKGNSVVYLQPQAKINTYQLDPSAKVFVYVDEEASIPLEGINPNQMIVAHANDPEIVFNLDSTKSYTTIQAAIDSADTLPGHKLFLAPKIISEIFTITKSLTLTSLGHTVFSPGAAPSSQTAITVNAPGVVEISNLNVENYRVVIEAFSPLVFKNNVVTSPANDSQAKAIILSGATQSILENNQLIGSFDYAIELNASTQSMSSLTITKNIIEGHHGLKVTGASMGSNTISNLMVAENIFQGPVHAPTSYVGVDIANVYFANSEFNGNTFSNYLMNFRVDSSANVFNVRVDGVQLVTTGDDLLLLAAETAVSNLETALMSDLMVKANLDNAYTLALLAEEAVSVAISISGIEPIATRLTTAQGILNAAQITASRRQFNSQADAVNKLTNPQGQDIALIDYNPLTYHASVLIDNGNYLSVSGTGIFQLFADLGVKQVSFDQGDTWISAVPYNLSSILANANYIIPIDENSFAISYQAKIQPQGYVEFVETFTVTFTLSEQASRAKFNSQADLITELKNSNNQVVAWVDYNPVTYSATVILKQGNYLNVSGTGIFQLLANLGVQEVSFDGGLTWLAAVPSNLISILANQSYVVVENVNTFSIAYQARVKPSGYAQFTQEFKVTFTLSESESRNLFNGQANAITEIKDGTNTVVATVDYNPSTYQASVVLAHGNYLNVSGTGIFQLLADLGVKQVSFDGGTTWIDAVPSELTQLLSNTNYIVTHNVNSFSISFTAFIEPAGYASFTQPFTVNFTLSEDASRANFNSAADAITAIKDSHQTIVALVNYDPLTYTATVLLDNGNYLDVSGTGIFQLFADLGVQQVSFDGTTWLQAVPANLTSILANSNYIVSEGENSFSISYQATIKPTGYAQFRQAFKVTFTLSENAARALFNQQAQAITQIKDGSNQVVALVNYNPTTYTATVVLDNGNYVQVSGTGIFQLFADLGVQQVSFDGNTWLNAVPANLSSILANSNYIHNEGPNTFSITYQAKIKASGYASFTQTFKVTFTLSEVESRNYFNQQASDITEIQDGTAQVVALVSYDPLTYTAVVVLDNGNYLNVSGTGIFQLLADLGVKQVSFDGGVTWLDAVPTNLSSILTNNNYLVSEGENSFSISYLAKIKPTGYADFIQTFKVTFNLSDVESRKVFNEGALAISEIRDGSNKVVALVNYDATTYTATVILDNGDYLSISGTGIFELLADLGVQQISFDGQNWLNPVPENLTTLLANSNYIHPEGDNSFSISYQAKIKPSGYASFTQNFKVTFTLSESASRLAFNTAAQAITEIKDGNDDVVASVSYNSQTYNASVVLANGNYFSVSGTGIFELFADLGVLQVSFDGKTWLDAVPSNLLSILANQTLVVQESNNSFSISYQAKIRPANYATFTQFFKVTFTLSEMTSRLEFNSNAELIDTLVDGSQQVIAYVTYDSLTYTAQVMLTDGNYLQASGTGIFQILADLGVQSVRFEENGAWINAVPSNLASILANQNYIVPYEDGSFSITYEAQIQPEGYALFTQQFVVTFSVLA